MGYTITLKEIQHLDLLILFAHVFTRSWVDLKSVLRLKTMPLLLLFK